MHVLCVLQARRLGSAPALALLTASDPASLAWTLQRPSAALVHRLAVLAKRSLAMMQVRVSLCV